LRRCGFFDNENGILGGHGECTIDIRHCEFGYNSLSGDPAAHNLYIGPAKKLVFMFNYSHHAKIAHLLKSRAAENIVAYNRMADEADGTGSYVINLPNAGRALIVGNILHQGPGCRNRVMVAYGEEGARGEKHELYVVNNTFVNDCERGQPVFVSVRRVPDRAIVVLRNNIFAGRGLDTNWEQAVREGNFRGALKEVLFENPAERKRTLAAGSPCVDKGIDPGTTADREDLTPLYHYVHPASFEPRPRRGRIDAGAFER
jgi:hypothetical protein